eukprot:5596108-Ditylum_brightwellii.AAC.1
MMIRFSRRSLETHQIKNKPIGGGCKFCALTTLQGFVANFTSDGRTASKSGRQESSANNSDGEIEPMILFVTSVIDNFREKQKQRLDKTATRVRENEREADVKMDKFYMAMDNYFTLPQVIKRLTDKGIGVVGTASCVQAQPPGPHL